ncbi:periplasmic heavy metal sensor [bacterium M00.F.Ca.ET.228.01.1.1]|uniref:periplasmic heavy metal sensor n=1 Tax=Paraburkholderia phenoliruptrix TaxID=252970 RepID=UPI00109231C5|nr:periplasmic heavy metal sensor [Paraburkholderia phenoliruptrix]TGP43280.1 periplasmic heavy metal sensor [bacterium M00.F.Ca.ET.228.01.1.1]TGS00718.1 periplasmic heavy metal sensor [bacterium M00.F.Ca.ET.191.01.1.1]TGU05105.1 periplasmic heavy metal sensor [bacterium M00.F.Ca.ET.155.01.1.1]MBW0446782.1 periplasmic heavy metal sensor [Paraburkholderia phenoliruptrix]MBW9099278.1 periplasmic heavy metal sensor [Paraburkholderia phenoliruptrix]
MSTRKISRALAVAATALAIGAGAAYAAQPAHEGPGGPGGPGGWHGHFMKELTQLHDQLKLNADQEKQWQAALDTMKQGHEAMRANHEQMKNQFKAAQQQPILDLNAMAAAHQQIEQKDAQLRQQTTDAWLKFYDGLNDQQKTTVSTALKQRFAKMESRHEKMRERWQQHHGAAPAPAASQ